MCHFFVVCLYLYYCSRHPVFKRRELLSHYQITSRHVYVAFSYLYCCFIVCSYLYYCCVHPIFRRRELCSYQQIKSRHVCVSFFYWLFMLALLCWHLTYQIPPRLHVSLFYCLFIFVLLLWTSNFQEKRIIIPFTD